MRLLSDGFDSVDELYADDQLGQLVVSVETAPSVLCRLGEFEDHGERRLVGEASLGSHGTVSHGTTSLFAALDVATGFIIGKCYRRHRTREFLDFLKEIDRSVPEGLDIHVVMANYATHKTAAVKAWLARPSHWHVHFTPTSASWINQVERWFAELTRKQLQRGVHTSTRQLEADIRAFIDRHNEDPKPFKWTKSADDILAAVKRFCLRVEQNLCHEL